MKITFLELAKKILGEEKKALSPEEIWEIAVNKNYYKSVASKGKTPIHSVGARIYTDLRDNRKTELAMMGERPRRFILKKNIEKTEGKNTSILNKSASKINKSVPKKTSFLEKDIHPFLAYYGNNFLNANLRTINHSRSAKKEFGEWVHPDVVGCYFPFADWKSDVVDVSVSLGYSTVTLYSFELKRELGFFNLREAFFQAVSNSSWANEGYLVAAIISEDRDFHSELKRLSNSFGIGVIKLDIEDPDASEVIFPAKYNESVDWDTVNKLTLNKDFEEFLKRIKNDMMSKEIRKESYDKILEREELIKSITNKDNK